MSAETLETRLARALNWLVDNSTPMHASGCAALPDDDECVCGVSREYQRVLDLTAEAAQDAERASRPDALREAAVRLMSTAEWNENETWTVTNREMTALEREVRRTALAAPAPAPALDAERLAADALLNWYDTTHGDEFGHDHHCPLGGKVTDPERCTCGWSAFLLADGGRA